MGNDLDHPDDKMPSAGSTKDLSTGRNLHCKKQPQFAKCQDPFKTRPRPVHDRIDASRTPDNRANNTKSLLLFLLSVTNFHHFSEKFLAVSDPRRRRPRRPGTNSVRAMTLRTITSAMRELHEDKGKAFIADRIEILVDRVHHGAGYTAR